MTQQTTDIQTLWLIDWIGRFKKTYFNIWVGKYEANYNETNSDFMIFHCLIFQISLANSLLVKFFFVDFSYSYVRKTLWIDTQREVLLLPLDVVWNNLKWFRLCSMHYAVRSMQHAVCSMQYAVCSMQYAVCSMQYDKTHGGPMMSRTNNV